MIIVIGHKNPDTDSVAAAEMFARFLEKEGKEAKAAVAGEVNKETEFVFSRIEKELPEVIKEEEKEERSVFLVDHNDPAQSIAKENELLGVLDHHHLAGLSTNEAIYFRVEPVGSTCTIIYGMMKDREMEVGKEEAVLLLSGIISDTLNLTSSTTTTDDIDRYHELADIADLDPENYAKEMFEAKSDFSDTKMKDIVKGDFKEYEFGEKKVGVGVAETTSLKFFNENEEELMKTIQEVKEEEGFDIFLFGVVDIIEQNTWLYPAGEEERKVAREVLEGEEKKACFLLEGVTSRKKEIIPPLSEHLKGKS